MARGVPVHRFSFSGLGHGLVRGFGFAIKQASINDRRHCSLRQITHLRFCFPMVHYTDELLGISRRLDLGRTLFLSDLVPSTSSLDHQVFRAASVSVDCSDCVSTMFLVMRGLPPCWSYGKAGSLFCFRATSLFDSFQ